LRSGEKKKGRGVRVAGVEEGGSGRNRGKLHNIAQYFAIERSAKRREPTKIGREPGSKGTGSGKITPPPLSPHKCFHFKASKGKL